MSLFTVCSRVFSTQLHRLASRWISGRGGGGSRVAMADRPRVSNELRALNPPNAQCVRITHPRIAMMEDRYWFVMALFCAAGKVKRRRSIATTIRPLPPRQNQMLRVSFTRGTRAPKRRRPRASSSRSRLEAHGLEARCLVGVACTAIFRNERIGVSRPFRFYSTGSRI